MSEIIKYISDERKYNRRKGNKQIFNFTNK